MAKKKPARKRVSAPNTAHIKELPGFVLEQVLGPTSRAKRRAAKVAPAAASGGSAESASPQVLQAAESISPKAALPENTLPADIQATTRALAEQQGHRFHGAKINLAWFPWRQLASPCADKFGYLTPTPLRNATRLPFDVPTMKLLDKLGALMGDPGRETAIDSPIPAGFTYVGQFVDHDITLDVSSRLDQPTDAETIDNMRSPPVEFARPRIDSATA